MLRSAKHLEGFTLAATDGEIGRVFDFSFDDERWVVRYLVADTGGWLGRLVGISPIALGRAGPDEPVHAGGFERHLAVRLTRQQVEESPTIDILDRAWPEQERLLLRHYGWPPYWGGPSLWGATDDPGALFATGLEDELGDEAIGEETAPQPGDRHLRSMRDVLGYRIRAADDEVGHVEDFIIDDETWRVAYMVVDTRNWLPGRKVLVAPQWVDEVGWPEREVHVGLSRQKVEGAPEWDPNAPVNRDYEQRLYDYYGRPVYWR